MASKLACAGVRSAPKKADHYYAIEREPAPSPPFRFGAYRGAMGSARLWAVFR